MRKVLRLFLVHFLWIIGIPFLLGIASRRNSSALDPYAFRIQTDGKIVAIGDLHGDIEATRAALRLAEAINTEDHWIAENLVVVQTGDQIDRADEDKEILDLLEHLTQEAIQHRSHLIILNGNHELMNAASDMRYVTPAAFRKFQEFPLPDPPQNLFRLELSQGDQMGLPGIIVNKKDAGVSNRAHAFLPGGKYARLLAQRSFFAIVNNTVFVHGGITPDHIHYGLDRINREIRAWLMGENPVIPMIITRDPENPDNSPLWTRLYSVPPDQNPSVATCHTLEQALAALKVKRMVVGHTIQDNGINSGCKKQLWRIDVALSRGFNPNMPRGARTEVLEIQGNEVNIVREKTAENSSFDGIFRHKKSRRQ